MYMVAGHGRTWTAIVKMDTAQGIGNSHHIAAAAEPLQLRLFGGLCAQIRGEPVGRLNSRKSLWLLAMLVLKSGEPISRGHAAGSLWPDSPDSTALHNLRQSLAELRRALGEHGSAIATEGNRLISIRTDAVTSDVMAFDRAIANGAREALELAVTTYAGPLLPEVQEPWASEPRAARENAYVAALEQLGRYYRNSGDHRGAEHWWRLAIQADPYRESAYRELMQCLADDGNRATAAQVYRDLRTLLARDLRTEPGDETRALYREIRNERPSRGPLAPPAQAQGRVPRPLTALIGRKQEISEVCALLTQSRLVTLTGPGGVGKTRLAMAVSEAMGPSTEGGIWFVDLTSIQNGEFVDQAIATSMNFDEEPRRPAAETIAEKIGNRHVAIVLDNCEHLLEWCAISAEALLARCENVHILATSRQSLGLEGEVTVLVPPLSVPSFGSEPEDYASEAVDLFMARVRQVAPHWVPTRAAMKTIGEICFKLDGIPLAIELAAAAARAIPVEELHQRVEVSFPTQARRGSVSPRHQTLRASIEWSWDLLTPTEQTLLARLSIFAGGWSLAAAVAVASDSHLEPSEVIDLLCSLTDKSLVIFELGSTVRASNGSEGRYRLLETIRRFAAGKLAEVGDTDRLRTKHRDYFLGWSESIDTRQLLRSKEQAVWFARMETEHDNLRSALDWCVETADAVAEAKMAGNLSRFWDTHGHLREGRDRVAGALSRVTDDVPAVLAQRLLAVGAWMACVAQDGRSAIDLSLRAIEFGKKHQLVDGMPGMLNFLGCAYKEVGRRDDARASFEEAVALMRDEHLVSSLAATLNNLAMLHIEDGDLDAARKCLEEGVRNCEEVNLHQLHAVALGNLATIAYRTQEYDEALVLSQRSLQLFLEIEAWVDVPSSLFQLALIYGAKNDWQRAGQVMAFVRTGLDTVGSVLEGFSEAEFVAAIESIEREVGQSAFAAACKDAARQPIADAVRCALELAH